MTTPPAPPAPHYTPLVPWSKRHKATFKGAQYNLSNSFAQPLTLEELTLLDHNRHHQQRGGSGSAGDPTDLFNEYHSNHSLEYTPNGGSLDLRQAVADLYGPEITADHILIFPGAQVALQTAAFAMTALYHATTTTTTAAATGGGQPSCHSIVFTPGYQSVQEAPIQAGHQVTTIPLHAKHNWQIQMDEVHAALRPNTKCIVVNVPHNPTGILMERSIQQALVELCQSRNIYILSDEVYRLLEHDENAAADDDDDEKGKKTSTRLPAFAELYTNAMSCVTLSKPWGGCGISIGWIACQDAVVMEHLVDAQYFGCACPSRASEVLAQMVLRCSTVILDRNVQIIQRNKALVQEFITSAYPQYFEWRTPNAGAIGFVKFKGPLTSEELGDRLMAEAGISIKPAYCFANRNHYCNYSDSSGSGSGSIQMCDDYPQYFRIGFGEEIMPRALEALARFVEQHKAEWG
jgi:aspartate/methionine/tyrosine aminotransferase